MGWVDSIAVMDWRLEMDVTALGRSACMGWAWRFAW